MKSFIYGVQHFYNSFPYHCVVFFGFEQLEWDFDGEWSRW
jgi:hypothetical protein